MKSHLRGAARNAGTGLFELLVVVVLLALLLGLAGLTVTTSRGAYDQGMLSADVEVQARRTLDRIADEFLSASAGSVSVEGMSPPPLQGITWLDYRPVTGFASIPLSGAQRRIVLVLAADELDDGLDNNSNGLVDECRIELLPDVLASTRAAGLVSHVRRLAQGELPNGLDDNLDGRVDEPGFGAEWEAPAPGVAGLRGGRLSLWLTLERRVAGQQTVTRTVRTTVRVRSQ